MRQPGGNHLDRHRLRLIPRAYAASPHAFGFDPHLAFVIPTGGDLLSARVAVIQHRLVWRYRNGSYPSGTELGRRFAFSSSSWSRTITGQRWPGTLLFAVLVDPNLPPSDRHPHRP